MSKLTEHQKLQEARRKDFEMIEVSYRYLKQVIVGDETLEQTKAALEEFKTNKELKAAGLRFNPNLARWLNVARDRIIRWERDHPEPESEPEPKTEPKPKGDKEPEKEPESAKVELPEEADDTKASDEPPVEVPAEPEADEEPKSDPE